MQNISIDSGAHLQEANLELYYILYHYNINVRNCKIKKYFG